MSIIKTSRIRLSELYQDSINFIKTSYNNLGQYFSMASPMGQLLQVMLSIGRMILYYVEDSITELNINTASRPQSIRGLATLTGHNPSRGQAARGTLRLSYNGQKIDIYGDTVIIPNYAKIVSSINGLIYTVILPSQEVRLNLTNINNYIDVNVVQGTIEYQQATGTGDPLQSFNFQSKKGAIIDNYFVNVYVDGKNWTIRDSILDMTYQEESCMVRTGQSGGIDVFFGNGYQGKIPPLGSTILVEYLLTDGEEGNITKSINQSADNWKFQSKGYTLNSQEVDLNKIIKVSVEKDIIFGALPEPIYLTRLLAPHVSRSFVLANANNYIYFLRKLNMFTIIDAIPGFATFEDRYALDKYNSARTKWEGLNIEYRKLVSTVGADSELAKSKKVDLDLAQQQVYYWSEVLNNQKKDDNTVYLYLVPDVNKRIPSNQNYYTCSLDSFILTDSEKKGILDLIEESGQRILTVDNAIMELKYTRFVLNISLIIYEGFELSTIRESIISKTSEYFLKNTRRDRIPASDLVRIIEGIDGVDSVSVWFDADKRNINVYGDSYGLDSYGDILLERYVLDAFGNRVPVRDIYPLVRGGWESVNGIYYEDSLSKDKLSNVNINLRGITKVDLNSNMNKNIVSNL
ncbi:MAG TPA: hypothetical protein P5513_03320 [Candidatus Diapherotrites archaeon]|nr:hypothetical protein [Candidatus Diapherotrites archaeon]